MKKISVLFFFMIFISACHSMQNKAYVGEWIEVMPVNKQIIQGVNLKEDGTASSIGMATLQYKTWKISGNQMILEGTSIGNGQTIEFVDTYDIKEITPNSLKLEKQNKYQIHYYRRGEYENKKSEIKVVTGILCIGHEVRSFTDEANGKEYWVIDKSGKLIKSYQAVIGAEIMKYQPIKAILKVQDIGEQTDGFGAEYEGIYEVKEIISLSQP